MNKKKWRSFINELKEPQQPRFNPNLSLISENIFDSLDLTHMSEAGIKLLMEGRKDNVLKKYGDQIDEDSLDIIVNFDEQYKYKHLNWMAKQLVKDITDGKNTDRVDSLVAGISDFVRYSTLMKKKDIALYADLDELLEAIEENVIKKRIRKAKEERDKGRRVSDQLFNSGQASVIYEDDRYFVIRPFTQESSCFFGSKTKWCISQQGNSYFSQYTQGEGKIFYFIKDDSKKNEDYNYKGALEVSSQYGSIYYNTLWDRNDDPISIESDEVEDLALIFIEDFEMPAYSANNIANLIAEHAFDNAPDSPLADLEKRISEGEWDGGFVRFNSDLETDEIGYINISADINFHMNIENERVLELLNTGKFDVDAAEEAIKESFTDDDELLNHISNSVDIPYSKDMLSSDVDHLDDHISISFVRSPNTETNGWVLQISFDYVRHEDHYYYTASDIDVAMEFMVELQDEWGERNELDLQEAFAEHIYRFIPQIAQEGAEKFRDLKANFQSGTYDLNDNISYTVDDDDDENSDLNLMMEFKFPLSPEMIDWLFAGKEMTNASGNQVRIAKTSKFNASKLLKRIITSQRGHEFLEKGIYNIYQNGIQFAQRQLKLDFGPDFNFEEDLEMPEIPSSVQVNTSLKAKGEEGLVPYSAILNIDYVIYIPFHKSEAELSAIMNFFLYISKNYEETTSYLYKYIELYAPPMNGGEFSGNPRPDKILAENLYNDILDTQVFLKAIKKQLKTHNRKS